MSEKHPSFPPLDELVPTIIHAIDLSRRLAEARVRRPEVSIAEDGEIIFRWPSAEASACLLPDGNLVAFAYAHSGPVKIDVPYTEALDLADLFAALPLNDSLAKVPEHLATAEGIATAWSDAHSLHLSCMSMLGDFTPLFVSKETGPEWLRRVNAAEELLERARAASSEPLVDEMDREFGPGAVASWEAKSEKAIVGRPHARFDLDRMADAIKALPGSPVVGRAIGDGR